MLLTRHRSPVLGMERPLSAQSDTGPSEPTRLAGRAGGEHPGDHGYGRQRGEPGVGLSEWPPRSSRKGRLPGTLSTRRRADRRGGGSERRAGAAQGIRLGGPDHSVAVSSRCIRQPGADGRQEFRGVHRLGYVVVRSGVQAALSLSVYHLAGDGDDREPREALLGPYGAHRVIAIHDRHHDVHEDHVRVDCVLKEGEGIVATLGHDHRSPPSLQEHRESVGVSEVVIDQEKLLAGEGVIVQWTARALNAGDSCRRLIVSHGSPTPSQPVRVTGAFAHARQVARSRTHTLRRCDRIGGAVRGLGWSNGHACLDRIRAWAHNGHDPNVFGPCLSTRRSSGHSSKVFRPRPSPSGRVRHRNRPVRLTDFQALSFDCYGTLIDWEAGIAAVLQRWANTRELDLGDEQLLSTYSFCEAAAEADHPAEPYPAILARSIRALGGRLGAPVSDEDAAALANSVPDWPAFADSHDALRSLSKRFKLIILSNVDRTSFAASNLRLGVSFA